MGRDELVPGRSVEERAEDGLRISVEGCSGGFEGLDDNIHRNVRFFGQKNTGADWLL